MLWWRSIFALVFAVLAGTLAFPVLATEITSTSFKVLDPVLDDGGVRSSSTSYILHGRIGETAIGRSTSASYVVVAGSAAFAQPAAVSGTTVSSGVTSGGGAGGPTTSVPTVVDAVISGRAYPNAVVTILHNEQVAKEASAGADGFFAVRISAIQAGRAHTFGAYGRDGAGRVSARLTYTVNVPVGVVQFNLTDIFLPPTVVLDRGAVTQGEEIAVRGVAFPKSAVTVEIPARAQARVTADAQGAWEARIGTGTVPPGEYAVRARAEKDGAQSETSVPLAITIAGLPLPPPAPPVAPPKPTAQEIIPTLPPVPEKKPEIVKEIPVPLFPAAPSKPSITVRPAPAVPEAPLPPVQPDRARPSAQVQPTPALPVAPLTPLTARPPEPPETRPRFEPTIARVQEGFKTLSENIQEAINTQVQNLRDIARSVPKPKDVTVPIQHAFERAAKAVPRVIAPIITPISETFTEVLPAVFEPVTRTVQDTLGKVGRFFGRWLK